MKEFPSSILSWITIRENAEREKKFVENIWPDRISYAREVVQELEQAYPVNRGVDGVNLIGGIFLKYSELLLQSPYYQSSKFVYLQENWRASALKKPDIFLPVKEILEYHSIYNSDSLVALVLDQMICRLDFGCFDHSWVREHFLEKVDSGSLLDKLTAQLLIHTLADISQEMFGKREIDFVASFSSGKFGNPYELGVIPIDSKDWGKFLASPEGQRMSLLSTYLCFRSLSEASKKASKKTLEQHFAEPDFIAFAYNPKGIIIEAIQKFLSSTP